MFLAVYAITSAHKAKFDPRAHAWVFLGCPFGEKGYKVMNLASHSVHVSRDYFS